MSALQEAFVVLDRLEELQGRLVKEALLVKHRDNPALKSILRLALGPYRYFVTPPSTVMVPPALDLPLAWRCFVALTKQLRTRELTGAAALNEVRRFLSSCPRDAAKWFTRILNHDLRIGVGTEIVKTIWGQDFLLGREAKTAVWQFSGCALAQPWKKAWPDNVVQFPLAVERKLDGDRALVFAWPSTQDLIVVTRNAKRRSTVEVITEFKQQVFALVANLNAGGDVNRSLFLDGEFLAKNWNETSSVIRRTKNFDPQAFLDKITLYLFDWSPVTNYLAGEFSVPWIRRKSELLAAAGSIQVQTQPTKFSRNLSVLGHTMVYTEEQLQTAYEESLDAGYEGIVAKLPDAPHVFKRTVYLSKMKPEDTVTVTITGAVAGQGKHAAITRKSLAKVRAAMLPYGDPRDDGSYYYWDVADVDAAVALLREHVADDTDRRIELTDTTVVLRHGERLGYFTATTDQGDEVHVGGGYRHKTGKDQRMDFWQRRGELIGKKIDIRVQHDDQQVGICRFNRFERFRDDL
jgi:hypothetical protein